MYYQYFIMSVLCLLLIVGDDLGYNSMQKKDSDTEKDQQIASLTTRVEALEKQQDEILSALEEAAKAQEEAKKKAEEEAKNQKAQAEEISSGDASEDAKKDEKNTDETEAEDISSNEDSEELVYKNGTYTGDGQGFGGNIQVQVTLENDTITDIQVVSAPGEDSAEFICLIPTVSYHDHIAFVIFQKILHITLQNVLQIPIQRRKRFIQKNHLRLSDHHTRESHPLLLTARKLRRKMLLQSLQMIPLYVICNLL